jgi:hypothetical protein
VDELTRLGPARAADLVVVTTEHYVLRTHICSLDRTKCEDPDAHLKGSDNERAQLVRSEKLASGEWVEHVLACGHAVTYDVRRDNPRPGDIRLCFTCHRSAEVIR